MGIHFYKLDHLFDRVHNYHLLFKNLSRNQNILVNRLSTLVLLVY